MSEDVIHVTDAAFDEEVLKAQLPVLVDFWATWCGPCMMIAPALDKIAQNYKGKLKVVKVNVDENMKIPARYGISGIPTLYLFKGGEIKERKVGYLSLNELESFVTPHL